MLVVQAQCRRSRHATPACSNRGCGCRWLLPAASGAFAIIPERRDAWHGTNAVGDEGALSLSLSFFFSLSLALSLSLSISIAEAEAEFKKADSDGDRQAVTEQRCSSCSSQGRGCGSAIEPVLTARRLRPSCRPQRLRKATHGSLCRPLDSLDGGTWAAPMAAFVRQYSCCLQSTRAAAKKRRRLQA